MRFFSALTSVSTVAAALSLSLATILFTSAARAEGNAHEPNFSSLYSKKPATRYTGNTPIDLSNGLTGNNGTYGNENKDYESWSEAPAVVAGLSEMPYSYKQKGEFVRTLQEQVLWGETAIADWKNTSSGTRAEAVDYSKAAVEKLSPILDRLKSATDKADGAGEKDWANSETDARRALIDMRTAYTQLHHNTQWKSRRAQVEH